MHNACAQCRGRLTRARAGRWGGGAGDGFIGLDEFLFHLDDSEESRLRRAAPTLDGLPCRAVYRGSAKVLISQEGSARSWAAAPAEDHAAVGRPYEAVIGKRISGGRYQVGRAPRPGAQARRLRAPQQVTRGTRQVTFSHTRTDPLAGEAEAPEGLYQAFSDFPSTAYTVTQVRAAPPPPSLHRTDDLNYFTISSKFTTPARTTAPLRTSRA